MSVEELLKPRYKVIADYPKSVYHVGDVINAGTTSEDCIYCDREGPRMRHYPHLFEPLPWWKDRKVEDLPEYVRITGVGCTIEKDEIAKVFSAGFFEDNGRNLGNEGQQYLLIADKYTGEYGHTRINCRNCIPATLADYEAYLQTTNQLKDGQ